MNNYKGILLAGGSGTRLHPITKAISKHLIPIGDKPMIFYPLSTLMLAQIREIMLISTPSDLDSYKKLLGNGNDLGINITYAIQEKPDGIASSIRIAKEFIGDSSVCLILGDNIFYGYDFKKLLIENKKFSKGAKIFGYKVSDPERFGVVEFDSNEKVISLEEKPKVPKSNYAVVGLYLYDNSVVKKIDDLTPSPRGELEITDLNKIYLKKSMLSVKNFEKGFAWLDTGTPKSLQDASNFVNIIEERQGIKLACLEEIAYRNQWIGKKQLKENIKKMGNTPYAEYLQKIINEG